MTSPDWKYDTVQEKECSQCGANFETRVKTSICPLCNEEEYHRSMAAAETPDGGFPQGSDMDRL